MAETEDQQMAQEVMADLTPAETAQLEASFGQALGMKTSKPTASAEYQLPALDPEENRVPPVAPAQQPVVPATPEAGQVAEPENKELQEWLVKKNFESFEDVARSLRNMEKEFHRRNQLGHPGYVNLNPPPVEPQAGALPQSIASMPDSDVKQQLADLWASDPVGFGVAVSQFETNKLRQELQAERQTSKRDKEFVELNADPDFRLPEIQFEIERVFAEKPYLFQVTDKPYTEALKDAKLRVIARKLAPPTSGNAQQFSPAPKFERDSAPPPIRRTEKSFEEMTIPEQEEFLTKSGGFAAFFASKGLKTR